METIKTPPVYEVKIVPQYSKACGLDIHKNKICGFISDSEQTSQVYEEFGTMTSDLYQIRDWLTTNEVIHVIMESTGVYWITLYSILQSSGINVYVVNPCYTRQIVKQKTDKRDSKWLCKLLLNGLFRQSYIPSDKDQIEMRDYCRIILRYGWDKSKKFNQIVKILERSNIKIRSVVSNINIKSARIIVKLLALGVTDIDLIANECLGSLRQKIPQMKEALNGFLKDSDKFSLLMLLEDISNIESQMAKLEEKIGGIIESKYEDIIKMLEKISGVGENTAKIIISEAGDNLEDFETADKFVAWAGLAPGNHESAGKSKKTKTRSGNTYVRLTMVSAARGAVKTKNSYWNCLYWSLRKRMPDQKAIIAIARRLLKLIFKTIKYKVPYIEGGVQLFEKIREENRLRKAAIEF